MTAPGTTGSDAVLSARNPSVQHVRRLARRRTSREEHGQFVIEGPILVGEALASGCSVETAFLASDARRTDDLDRVCQALVDSGIAVRSLAPGVLERVGDTSAPQGIIGVVRGRAVLFDDFLADGPHGLVVVLADVADPGNAGTLVRTAEATGASAVVFAGTTVDPLSPKVLRAAAGSAFRVPLVSASERDIERLREQGFTLVGTVPSGGIDYSATTFAVDTALLLGSEAHGLAPSLLDRLDQRLTIPMAGAVESLNVAVAGSLVCFEYARQRVS
jgi:RNA methyltransferase, TrmH family